ncbi:hypothetical protein [Pseudomonas schmalbachii]|uniref:Lipoprotein n=1 Tax=Pseudomonas schmalbachii TaxID=2816993 RepID=A0ABS3TU03_9PSED|nr:hypothetical protein [Pseudomonas schmalbachii]MBO3276059.1 hypothetical protein [Pseudomonas schmalbachii]
MKRSLIPLSALLLAALLSGCGEESKPAKVADSAPAEAAVAPVDPCADSTLAKALPPATSINGYEFLSRSCGYNDASAVYGKADGSQRLELSLTDTGMPAPEGGEQSGVADSYRSTQAQVRDMTRRNVELLQSTREKALQNGTAQQFGGESYLPLIEKTSSGEPLAIIVAPADEAAPSANLTGLLKERYVLNLLSHDQPFGRDALAARKLLMPFVEQMKLGELR